jgi:hypothetical protein
MCASQSCNHVITLFSGPFLTGSTESIVLHRDIILGTVVMWIQKAQNIYVMAMVHDAVDWLGGRAMNHGYH